jgi:hypothetical protein
MTRHWKGILTWSLLLATAFIGFLIAEKPEFAFGALVAGLVTAYVVGIAWFNPRRKRRRSSRHQAPSGA